MYRIDKQDKICRQYSKQNRRQAQYSKRSSSRSDRYLHVSFEAVVVVRVIITYMKRVLSGRVCVRDSMPFYAVFAVQ
jgi:hypothetical protein